MIVNQNSDFIFGFEAIMTNPNGDPDQENKPRMDYETSTVLVSDVRRKRDVRDFLKQKGFSIFVDTLADKKVPMDKMFENVVEHWLEQHELFEKLLRENEELLRSWNNLTESKLTNYKEIYLKVKNDKKKKSQFTDFNNHFLTEIIKKSLIDIRLFGSAMAVEGVTRTYTGPVQITWGYSLHPVELLKSNTITSIMNDDASTFGKKQKLHYGLIAHYGTINKYSAQLIGMTDVDRELFRKSLVQGIMNNQTDSKQGQTPLFYIEVIYRPEFDGYLGDLRRYLTINYSEEKPIRGLQDLEVDFSRLSQTIKEMKARNYIDHVVGWVHPYANINQIINLPEYEIVDLWSAINN